MARSKDNGTTPITLDLSQYDGFNTLYFDLTDAYYNPDLTYIVSMGSGGSGKSYAMAQLIAIEATAQKKNWLIIRKVAATLNDSVIELMQSVFESLGVAHLWKLNKTDKIFTNINHGGKILCKGLEDPERIKSIANIHNVWVEESTELTEEDWKVLNDRIRGNPKMFLSFNPVSDKHWLKRHFYDSKKPKTLTLHTTYRDNLRFVGQKFIDEMKWYKEHDYDHYRVYGLGEWGITRTGQEWFRNFKRTKHVAECYYHPDLPIHITVDQNSKPYMTMLLRQVHINADTIRVETFDEICLEHPRNSTEDLCQELLDRYEHHGIDSIYYYGDSTGKNDVARKKREERYHHYDIIEEELFKYVHNYSDRVIRKNPPLAKSRTFYSRLLGGYYKGVEWVIDDRCKNTIHDLETLKEDKDGSYVKVRVKDEFGNTYEEGGHCTDALRYSDVVIFDKYFD